MIDCLDKAHEKGTENTPAGRVGSSKRRGDVCGGGINPSYYPSKNYYFISRSTLKNHVSLPVVIRSIFMFELVETGIRRIDPDISRYP